MEFLAGPAVVISGAEAGILSRQLAEAIRSAYTARGRAAPQVLLDFAIAVYRAARGSVPEPRNTPPAVDSALSDQSARTLSVKRGGTGRRGQRVACQAACPRARPRGAGDSQGPGYAIYADSLAAWQERRRREENDRKAA